MKNLLPLFLLTFSFFGCNKPADLEVTDDFEQIVVEEGFNPPDCGYTVGDIACNFELMNSQGEIVNLYDFKDDVIVLDFSTAWCYYCQMAAFDAQTVQDQYASQGLTYIIVLVEDFNKLEPTQELLKEWEDHFEITSVQVLSGNSSLIDMSGESGWVVEAWPTFYYIDREMKIDQYQRGFSATSVNAMIESLITE